MKKILIIVSLATLFLTGCKTLPVNNISNAPIVSSNKQLSTTQIKNAITRAGVSLGWIMSSGGEGKINASLSLRKHRANIVISYDQTKYSIQYQDSVNLKYDGTNIHKNYNGWIENLDNAIRSYLSGAGI